MRGTKKFLSILLALCMAVSLFTACKSGSTPAQEVQTSAVEESLADKAQTEGESVSQQEVYKEGDKMEDFTVTTCDGKTVSLYELLEEKEVVFLSFFATWCGSCSHEFPFMVEAYEQYKDQAEILMLSVEPDDSDEILSAYAAKHGLPFPVTQDAGELRNRFPFDGIPLSVVVDRFGTICLIEVGAQASAEPFHRVFELFTSDDYKETQILPGINFEIPDVQPETSETLAAVLDSDLTFKNSSNSLIWPMISTEKDGRSVLVSSNQKHPGNRADIEMDFQSKEGDALVMEFHLQGTSRGSTMLVSLDGETVQTFLNGTDWRTYALPIEEPGEHHVTISFSKEALVQDTESALYLDRIVLASGDDAKKALEQNPKYPVAAKTDFSICNADGQRAREVILSSPSDPNSVLTVYLISSPTAEIFFHLDSSVNPEEAYLSDGETFTVAASECIKGDEYHYSYPMRPDAFLNCVTLMGTDMLMDVYLFTSEEAIEEYMELTGIEDAVWQYADEVEGNSVAVK